MVDAPAFIRAKMREQRVRLTPAERIAAASGVAASLEQLPEFLVDQRIAGYWAVGGEVPLHATVARLNARGQHYYLPIVGEDRRLRFAPLKSGANLKPNRYGIPEPECAENDLLPAGDIDVVLVPLTAFDRAGHRLGMGAGYYDRSFAFLRYEPRPSEPLLVGIGYAFQEVATLPEQDWDVALDFIATDKELIDCTPPETRP
ncbi:MAG: 5-formyltetrahydrofolate cyclo-ligase [Proteobacteria bacterium]|nr:5-formyltetrahydrofolate cyclo-ligase [Pseudomonadota bacterium]